MKTVSRVSIIIGLLIITPLLMEQLNCRALAGIQDTKETGKQEEYPTVFRPGPEPHSIFQKNIDMIEKTAVPGSIEFLDVDLNPLLSEEVGKVELWVGSDLGYIIVEKTKSGEIGGVIKGYRFWRGRISGYKGWNSISFSISPEGYIDGNVTIGIRIFGIDTFHRDEYRTTILHEVDRDKIPPIRDIHSKKLPNARNSKRSLKAQTRRVLPSSPETQSIIDILFIYSQQLEQQLYDSNKSIEQVVQEVIVWANTAFDNSEVNITINAAGLEEYSFTEMPSVRFGLMLNNMTNGKNEYIRLPATRDQYDADFVICLQTFKDDPEVVPWTLGRIREPIHYVASGSSETAFAVVQIPMEGDFRLTFYTPFTHEIGHLLSLHHSFEDWVNSAPDPNERNPRFKPYGWGYFFVSNSFDYGTIMTQANARIQCFSNPNLTTEGYPNIPGGPYPVGYWNDTSDPNDTENYRNADAHRALNEFKDVASAYRAKRDGNLSVINSNDSGKNTLTLSLTPINIAPGSGLNIMVCEKGRDPNNEYPMVSVAWVCYSSSYNRFHLVCDTGYPSTNDYCTPGTQHVLRNGQVSINADEVKASSHSITVPMSFNKSFFGKKSIWVRYTRTNGEDDWAIVKDEEEIEFEEQTPSVWLSDLTDINDGHSISEGKEVDVKVGAQHLNGNTKIKELYILITGNSPEDFTLDQGVLVRYEPRSVYDVKDRMFYWWNHNYVDGGTSYTTGKRLSDSYEPKANGQVEFDLSHSSATMYFKNNFDFNVRMKFKNTFKGFKSIYLRAVDYNGNDTGYLISGYFTVKHPEDGPQNPINLCVDPYDGLGPEVTFIAEYTDPQGPGNLLYLDLLVNDSMATADAAYVRYNVDYTQMQLCKNNGTLWFSKKLPSSSVLENSQVKVHLSECEAYIQDQTYYMIVKMEFKPGFVGSKNVYLRARDRTGLWSLFEKKGDWIVQMAPAP